MPKYIDADALLAKMERRRYYIGRASDAICIIEDMPAADVEEVKHGYWIEYEYDGQMAIKCSVCGDNPGVIYTYRRCPECGAKMDGPEGGENADKR